MYSDTLEMMTLRIRMNTLIYNKPLKIMKLLHLYQYTRLLLFGILLLLYVFQQLQQVALEKAQLIFSITFLISAMSFQMYFSCFRHHLVFFLDLLM